MVGARQPPFRTLTAEMTPMLGVQLEKRAPHAVPFFIFGGGEGSMDMSDSTGSRSQLDDDNRSGTCPCRARSASLPFARSEPLVRNRTPYRFDIPLRLMYKEKGPDLKIGTLLFVWRRTVDWQIHNFQKYLVPASLHQISFILIHKCLFLPLIATLLLGVLRYFPLDSRNLAHTLNI